MSSTRVRDAVWQRSTAAFLEAYTELYQAACDASNGYPEGNAVQKRPPKAISALLI